MKSKITRKRVFETHKNVISVGYCNLYYLLQFRQPQFYTTRAEGWGADIYSVGTTAIVTGYAPFGNIVPSYDFVKTFNDKARAIQSERISYEDKLTRTADLLDDFLNQVTKHGA